MSNKTSRKPIHVVETFKESYKESHNEVNGFFYRFLSYPLIVILSFFILGITLFTIIPAINTVGYASFGGNIESLVVYYPVFIVLDIFIFGGAVKLVSFLAKKMISFAKKITSKTKTKGEKS